MARARVGLDIEDARADAHGQANVRARQPAPVFANFGLVRGLAPRLAIVESALLDAVAALRARRHREHLPATTFHIGERSIKPIVFHDALLSDSLSVAL